MRLSIQYILAMALVLSASSSYAGKTKKTDTSVTSKRTTKSRNTTPKKCEKKSVVEEKEPLIELSPLPLEAELRFNAEYFLTDPNEEQVSQCIEENYESPEMNEDVIHHPEPVYVYPPNAFNFVVQESVIQPYRSAFSVVSNH